MLDIERIRTTVETPTPAPLHARLQQAIYAQIMDNTLQPGEKLPSERKLQQLLELSRGPIRQAINTLIQAGLLTSVPGTGTFVLERQETASHLGLIGLIVSSANFHFFYPQLAAAFNARVRESGYGLVMALHSDRVDELSRIVGELTAQNVAALAVTPPRYGDVGDVVGQLEQRDLPLLFIGRQGTCAQVDCVATDNEQIGYQATRHLVQLGHRHIAHIGFLDYSTGQDRAAGYQRAMAGADLQTHIVELPGNGAPLLFDGIPDEHLAEPAYQVAQELWAVGRRSRPSAVFCFNDIVAMGVYKALRELELRVPQDVSIVAVDNLPTVRHFEVPLTTFALPGGEIGRQGAELLLRRLSGELMPSQRYLLPARLIERLSTGSPPSA